MTLIDFGNFVFWLFATISTIHVVHFGIYLTGANLYDVWQYRRQLRRTRNETQPLVTVVVPARNEEKVIVRCLESIRLSAYKNLEIIVANDASTDATATLVRRYRREHSQLNIRLVHKRVNVGKARALNHALRMYAKGEFVMTLDADSILSRAAVTNAISYFDDPAVAGVAANVRIIEEPTILGMLQKLEHMISYRSKKAYSLTNCEFVVGGVASTYRMDVLRRVRFYTTDTYTEDIGLSMKIVSNGNLAYRLVYAADVDAMTEGVSTLSALIRQRYRWKYGSLQNIFKYKYLIGSLDKKYTRLLTLYRMPMAIIGEIGLLFAPVVLGYVLYLTVTQLDPRLVLGAYLTITIYTLITLWFDDHASLIERIRLSLYAPIAYFIFYIMDIVQFIAAVRCLLHMSNLVGRRHVSHVWISPARTGRKVVA